MTSENQPANDSPDGAGTASTSDRPDAGAGPGPGGTVRPAARTQPAAPVQAATVPPPSRPRVLDWENEPAHGLDPEDSRGGGADNLARLLDDIPPHHVDH
jgi:hypothetical protein